MDVDSEHGTLALAISNINMAYIFLYLLFCLFLALRYNPPQFS